MATNNLGYYVMYQDTAGYWRWTFHASNHLKIAVSSEGYVNKADCMRSIDIIASSAGCSITER